MANPSCLRCRKTMEHCECIVEEAVGSRRLCHLCGHAGHSHMECPELDRIGRAGAYWMEFQHMGVMYAGLVKVARPGCGAHRPMHEGEAQLQAVPRPFRFVSPIFVYHRWPCSPVGESCSGQPRLSHAHKIG